MERHDRIVLAARIHTMAARGAGPAQAEAVHVVDGRIAAVGRRDEILMRRRHGTDVIDLCDAVLLPGLIEPHTHPDLCAQFSAWVDVSGFRHPEVARVEQALRDAIASTPAGSWIFAFGLDPMLTPDLGAWGRDRLDRLTTDHPVFVLIQSLHTAFVNSKALELAGIDETTPLPDGGHGFGRDAAGRLDGRLAEQPAMGPFMRFALGSPEAARDGLATQYRRYRDVGITSIGAAGLFGGRAQLPMLANVASAARTPVRTTAYLPADLADLLPGMPRDGDRWRVRGVKLWYDGSPYTGTMLLDEPYLDSQLCCCTLGIPAGTTGRANFSPDQLMDTLVGLHDGGWQVLTHTQGDRGCREMLDLYERVMRETRHGPAADHRWRLEHCALISPADLMRARELGVSPSFHVNHVRHYGPELRDSILGAERAQRLMPLAEAVRLGHRISLHADSPMYPADPLSLVRTAVTRRTRQGDVLGAHHAIDLETALRAVTVDAAWQLGLDGETGSIAPGLRADFTVLERDPAAVAAEDLDRIAVLDTWLDGTPTSA